MFIGWLAFCDSRSGLADSTKTNYRRVTKAMLAWVEQRPVTDLRLDGFVRWRLEEGIAPRTVDLELSAARMAIKWAKEMGTVPRDSYVRFPGRRLRPLADNSDGVPTVQTMF